MKIIYKLVILSLFFINPIVSLNAQTDIEVKTSDDYEYPENTDAVRKDANGSYVKYFDKSKNKYGIKSRKNEEIILEATFDRISNYFDNYFVIYKEGKAGLFDVFTKREVIPLIYSFIKILPKYDNRTIPMIFVIKDNKWGLLNENLKIVLPIEYDYIDYDFDNYYKIAKGGKSGLFNMSSEKIIVPTLYERIDRWGGIIVQNNKRFGFYDKNGNMIINPNNSNYTDFEGIEYPFFAFKRDTLYGIFDTNINKVVVPDKYTSIELIRPEKQEKDTTNQRYGFRIRKGNKFGILSKDYKEVLNCEFDDVPYHNKTFFYTDETILVRKENKYGIWDWKTETLVVPVEYRYIEVINSHQKPYQKYYVTHNDEKKGLYSSNFSQLLENKYDLVKYNQSYDCTYFSFRNEGKYGVCFPNNLKNNIKSEYDSFKSVGYYWVLMGQKNMPFNLYSQNGDLKFENVTNVRDVNSLYARTRTNSELIKIKNSKNKTGIINSRTDKTIIPFEYDDITFYNFNTYIARKDGKYGLLDTNNKAIIPFIYDTLSFLSPYTNLPILSAKKKNSFGLISLKNEIVIKFIYEDIKYINEFYSVKEKGKYYIIKTDGNKINDTGFDETGLFNNNFCRVLINGRHEYINTNGEIEKGKLANQVSFRGFSTLKDFFENFVVAIKSKDDSLLYKFCQKTTIDEYSREFITRYGLSFDRFLDSRKEDVYNVRLQERFNNLLHIRKRLEDEESLENLYIKELDYEYEKILLMGTRTSIPEIHDIFTFYSNGKKRHISFFRTYFLDGYWKICAGPSLESLNSNY